MLHAVLTVGTNPLPVWVACRCLQERDPAPDVVTLLCTEKTKGEAVRIKDALDWKVVQDPEETSASDPAVIAHDLKTVLEGRGEGDTVHVHYTGGTKIQIVSLVEAARKLKEWQGFTLETSYLDPRGANGPCLTVDGKPGAQDARDVARLSLNKLALLHDWQESVSFTTPKEELVTLAAAWLGPYQSPRGAGSWRQWKDWVYGDAKAAFDPLTSGGWNSVFAQLGRANGRVNANLLRIATNVSGAGFRLRLPRFLQSDASAIAGLWSDTIKVVNGSLELVGRPDDLSESNLNDLHALYQNLVQYGWVEVVVYSCFRKALEDCGRGEEGNGWEVYQDVKLTKDGLDKDFQLDVVGVLGYQVVVVSCTVGTTEGRVKGKAFEAYHRARQLGGDEARAVVVCPVSEDQDAYQGDVATRLREDVRLDIGGDRTPLDVWGRSALKGVVGLKEYFEVLLRDLRWSS